MLTGAATIFTVRDVAASRDYYRDALGFGVTFEWGTPASYVCLCRDDVALHLRAAHMGSVGNGAVAIFVRDGDALHAEFAARGAKVVKPPQDYPYGMRDFSVTDLDGNELTYGMAITP